MCKEIARNIIVFLSKILNFLNNQKVKNAKIEILFDAKVCHL